MKNNPTRRLFEDLRRLGLPVKRLGQVLRTFHSLPAAQQKRALELVQKRRKVKRDDVTTEWLTAVLGYVTGDAGYGQVVPTACGYRVFGDSEPRLVTSGDWRCECPDWDEELWCIHACAAFVRGSEIL